MNAVILIIEPDQDYYIFLKNQLKDLKYSDKNIWWCASLEESLAIDPGNINFIFANLILPCVGILSPIKELNLHFINVPIIILSDNEDADSNIYAISQGAQDVMVKGQFNEKQLGKAIVIARERNAYLLKVNSVLDDYKLHFENGPIPMWIIDSKTLRFLIVNNAAIEKYGYSQNDFTRMTILDIRPKEDVGPMLDNYSKRDRDNYFDAGHWRHVKKNGEIFYVHIYTHETRFQNIDARLCFALDVNDKLITDLRNKELLAVVNEQNQKLDVILSSINDAIWSRDANTNDLLYANIAYYNLYGFIPGIKEPLKELDLNAIHPDDRDKFMEAIETVKRDGKVDYTYRFIDQGGGIKVLSGRATFNKGVNGKRDSIDGITTDITKEKEWYDTIRNSEQKLLATINNTKDHIWTVDKDLKIIFCNRAFQDFFHKRNGIALDEGDCVLGNWYTEAFNNRRRKEYEMALKGDSFTTVVEFDFEGEKQYNEINSSPIIGIDEKIIGVNCVSRDITEQVNQVKRISEQNEKLRQIAWIQSHKVKGAVANIIELIPQFDDVAEASENSKELMGKLRTATKELDEMIKGILRKTEKFDSAGRK